MGTLRRFAAKADFLGGRSFVGLNVVLLLAQREAVPVLAGVGIGLVLVYAVRRTLETCTRIGVCLG